MSCLKGIAFADVGFNVYAAILKISTSENDQSGTPSDYYISNDGNDNNSGLSPGLAWKTVAKVNSFTFLPGDRVFFKRGGEWRESLLIGESGTSDAMITFGAYGTGAKPIFNGADIVTGWSSSGSNVWAANCPTVLNYSGLPYDYVAILNGTLLSQVGSLVAVDAAGKYFIDTSPTPDKIYLFSTTDPNTKKVEVSARVFGVGVTDRSFIKLQNLDLRNSSHTGAYFNTNNLSGQFAGHCIVDSCNLYRNRIAGIEFDNGYSYNNVQYCSSTYNGNGFYSWSNQTWGSDYNTFTHCYSANSIRYSVGNITDGHGFGIYNSSENIIEYCESNNDSYGINIDAHNRKNNIIIRYNYVHNTQTGTPGINAGGDVPAGTVHQIYGNLVLNVGAGKDGCAIWIFGTARLGSVYVYNNTIYLDGNVNHSGIGLNASSGTNLIMKNNIVYSNASNTIILEVNSGAGLVCDNNLFYVPNDMTNIFSINGINYHTLSAWQSASGHDVHSIYGDPLFVNNSYDWALQSGSPAINMGIDAGLKNDIKGNPIIGLPDMGAFEFQTGSTIPTPVFVTASVENATPSFLEMTYSLSLANIVPASAAFNVLVNSSSRTVNSVSIAGAKVQLTLASPVRYGDIITISYTKPAANPLQTAAGGIAENISLKPVTNNYAPDKPVYISSVIENSNPSLLEMTYSLSLANIVPAATAFNVLVNSVSRTVSSITIAGAKVQLTLASPVRYGDIITISYTKPAANPLQTTAGGIADNISIKPVTNNYAPEKPVYISSVIENSNPSLIQITYNLSLANIVPAASALTITVNSLQRSINTVSISGTKVLLTLSSPVVYGDVVSVSYTKPAANPIQTSSGGQAAAFSVQPVTNNLSNPATLGYVNSAIGNTYPNLLEIYYNLNLANVLPAVTAFSVSVNSVARNVNSVAISGSGVLLTLASEVFYGDVVTVAYAKPVTNPLQSTSGLQAATMSAQSVTNKVNAVGPVYVSSVIENSTPGLLEITFNETLDLTVPPISAFVVTVNGVYRQVVSVSVSGNKVILTLSQPVVYKNIVTVSYIKPANNQLKKATGESAVSFTFPQPVTNKLTDNSIKKGNISVYPNPAREVINISIKETSLQPQKLRIFDLSGKLRLESKLNSGTNNQILINIKSGIYVLQIVSGSELMFVQKLIVI